MALVLEDGSGLTNSNTYSLEAGFVAWLLGRGYVLSGTLSAENLLIQSIDYLETLAYNGSKNTFEQALQYPRTNVYIDGFSVPSDFIPNELINSQYQIAWSIDQGVDPMATAGQDIKSERVEGEVEVVYQDDTSSQAVITSVNRALRKLLANSGASFRANQTV